MLLSMATTCASEFPCRTASEIFLVSWPFPVHLISHAFLASILSSPQPISSIESPGLAFSKCRTSRVFSSLYTLTPFSLIEKSSAHLQMRHFLYRPLHCHSDESDSRPYRLGTRRRKGDDCAIHIMVLCMRSDLSPIRDISVCYDFNVNFFYLRVQVEWHWKRIWSVQKLNYLEVSLGLRRSALCAAISSDDSLSGTKSRQLCSEALFRCCRILSPALGICVMAAIPRRLVNVNPCAHTRACTNFCEKDMGCVWIYAKIPPMEVTQLPATIANLLSFAHVSALSLVDSSAHSFSSRDLYWRIFWAPSSV